MIAWLGCILGVFLACDAPGQSPLPRAVLESPARAEPPARPSRGGAAEPSPGAAVGAVEPALEPRAPALSAPRVAWRFRTAAPTSGAPAVTEEGAVYLTSVDGYVHALDPGGVFRWSRGLAGIPIGAPAVDRAGHVYVATSARRIYAVRPDGHLKWMRPTPARVATALAWAPAGFLYYAGRDRQVHALASWGGPLWHRRLDHPVTVAPAIADGWLLVGTDEPQLWTFRGASARSQLGLSGELTQPVLSNRDHWFVVAGGQLVAFEKGEQVAWRRQARHAALSADGRWLLAEADRELVWLDPSTGDELHRSGLPGDPSGAPALNDAGVGMVPMVSGDLVIARPGAATPARVSVAASPLWRPIWNERTQSVAVAAGSGAVGGIGLAEWSAAAPRESGRPPEPGAAPGSRTGQPSPVQTQRLPLGVEAKAAGSAGGGA